jgi:hypothetical protein
MSSAFIDRERPARFRLARAAGLTAVIATAVALAGGWSEARASHTRRPVGIPLAGSSLVDGEGLRTTVTNRGPRSATVEVVAIDADGEVVQQETVVIAPDESQSVQMARSEVGRPEPSVFVRTEVRARRTDLDSLWMTSEVIDWPTGATRFVAARGCPSFACGSSGNHNETMVRDHEEAR